MRGVGARRWILVDLENRVTVGYPEEALGVSGRIHKEAGLARHPLTEIGVEHIVVAEYDVPCRVAVDLVVQGDKGVVAQVGADVLVVDDGLDTDGCEDALGADTRQLQNLRRAEDTSGEDDLFACGDSKAWG